MLIFECTMISAILNMNKSTFLLLAFSGIFIVACQTDSQQKTVKETIHPLDRLPENEAGEVVKKAIGFVGGWETWENKRTLSFYKNITHVDSMGNVERNQRQLHQYQLKPQFKARMTWQDKGNDYMIINNGEQAKKYENGEEMTDDNSKNVAWNSSFGSHYVVSMPFKLTDPGVILTYEGIDSITLNKRVHSLKVEYEKGAGSSGGYHTWWYYFDEETYDLVANFLDYGEGYSLTTYETFKDIDSIRIHQKRFSHIANAEKEIIQKRTIYQNEEMKFNEDFDESLFELK